MGIYDELEKYIVFLMDDFVELEINEDIKSRAIELIKSFGLLPNDALIAATCRFYNISLITFDSDFKNIPWLKVIP